MGKIAIFSAILYNPDHNQEEFNKVVSKNKHIIRGRMGLPFSDRDIAVITITVDGNLEQIKAMDEELSKIPESTVNVLISQ